MNKSYTLTVPVHVDIAYDDVLELFESRAGASTPIDEYAQALNRLTATVAEGHPGTGFTTASLDTDDAVEFSVRSVVDGEEAGPSLLMRVPAQHASSLDVPLRYGPGHYGRQRRESSITYALADEGDGGTRIDVTMTWERNPGLPGSGGRGPAIVRALGSTPGIRAGLGLGIAKLTRPAIRSEIAAQHESAQRLRHAVRQALDAAIVERRGETTGLG